MWLIDQNEAFIQGLIKHTDITFDASKKLHLILRRFAEALTVYDVIMATPMSFRTLEEASLAMDIAAEEVAQCFRLLDQAGIVADIFNS